MKSSTGESRGRSACKRRLRNADLHDPIGTDPGDVSSACVLRPAHLRHCLFCIALDSSPNSLFSLQMKFLLIKANIAVLKDERRAMIQATVWFGFDIEVTCCDFHFHMTTLAVVLRLQCGGG